jgi:Asp-tRNA(Asn)/Glu-tRNA(Gln) amidotransferase C subunit
VIVVLKSVDYRLIEEKKGRIDRAVIVINNFHRLDLTKSEVWKLMQTLETVFDSMSDAEGIEAPFSNRKVVTEKG